MNPVIITLQILPAADPLPLPAPTWLLLFLLYLTFSLHMIAMNLTVGGGVMLSIFSFYGGEKRVRLVSFLSRALTILLAFTITLGVAPLLFVQVLYGRIFFTTSILMGWWWLIVVALLILAYYGFYLRQYSPRRFGRLRDALPLISTVMLLIIVLLYVANFKLFFRSDEWLDIYHGNLSGWFLNLSHPTVLPTYAHHIISAVAFGGLLIVFHGWSRRRAEVHYANWALRVGGLIYAISTLAHFIDGYLLISILPQELIGALMFGAAYETTVFMVGSALGTVSALLMVWAVWRRRYGWPVSSSVVLLIATMALMTLKRASVRDYFLADVIDVSSFETAPQWEAIALFGILLLVGLAVVIWMVRAVLKGKSEDAEKE